MIDQKIWRYPIIYSGVFGKYAIGWGSYLTVADECKKAGIKKALIVTTGLRNTGIVDEIKGVLNYNGVSTDIFDKVTTNPKDHEVMAGYKVFLEAECDGVVSVGGGSSHDCGKGIRVVVDNDGRDINDFAMGSDWSVMPSFKPVTTPQVAVNTTAGTSAETSFAAMITNTKKRIKQPFSMTGLVPNIGIIDPLLIRLMPMKLAAYTGWDAFAHAFESYISCIECPGSQAVAAKAIQLFAENIREFVGNPWNQRACEGMCWAESLAGTSVQFGGGVGLVHALGHYVSAITNGHHGHVNAALTMPVERYNQIACPEKFAEMVRLMGVDTRGMTKVQASDKWFEESEKLLADLNIETGHLNKQFGLKKEDIGHIGPSLSNDFCAFSNARAFNLKEWLGLLEDAI